MCAVTTYYDPPLLVRPGDRVEIALQYDLSMMVVEYPQATWPAGTTGCTSTAPFYCFAYPNPMFTPVAVVTAGRHSVVGRLWARWSGSVL